MGGSMGGPGMGSPSLGGGGMGGSNGGGLGMPGIPGMGALGGGGNASAQNGGDAEVQMRMRQDLQHKKVPLAIGHLSSVSFPSSAGDVVRKGSLLGPQMWQAGTL